MSTEGMDLVFLWRLLRFSQPDTTKSALPALKCFSGISILYILLNTTRKWLQLENARVRTVFQGKKSNLRDDPDWRSVRNQWSQPWRYRGNALGLGIICLSQSVSFEDEMIYCWTLLTSWQEGGLYEQQGNIKFLWPSNRLRSKLWHCLLRMYLLASERNKTGAETVTHIWRFECVYCYVLATWG